MKSIRRQLTRQLVLGTLFIASCGGAAAYLTMRAAVLRQFDEALLAKARAVCVLTKLEHDGRLNLEPDDVLSLGFTGKKDGHYFQLRTLDGKSVARSPTSTAETLPGSTNVTLSPLFRDIKLPGDIDGRAVGFTFTPDRDEEDEEDAGTFGPVTATITVASSRESLDGTLRSMLAALALSGGVLAVSSWVLVPRVLRRGLRPLDELADRVTGITADSLETRFPESGVPAEIAPIARRLNELLGRIGASFERERRFSADLAHELRTPLAELRSQAELALKWPDARSPTSDNDTLAIGLRMEHLVTRLLALARAEGGQSGTASERLPVELAVKAAWQPFAALAAARNLRVSFAIPTNLAVDSDPALLREILANLFSNAVDYTPSGGEVDIKADRSSGAFSLRVTNTVQGLEAKDVEKFFDRFWRKEAARSDDEHAGLGLALALGYARALGWDLSATLEGNSRLTLTLNDRC